MRFTLALLSICLFVDFVQANSSRCEPDAGVLLVIGTHPDLDRMVVDTYGGHGVTTNHAHPVAVISLDSCSFEDELKNGVLSAEFRKILDRGEAGGNINEVLRNTKKEEVERGLVKGRTGSIVQLRISKAPETYLMSRTKGTVKDINSDNRTARGTKGTIKSANGDSKNAKRWAHDPYVETAQRSISEPLVFQIDGGEDCDDTDACAVHITKGSRTVGTGVITDIIE